MWVDLLIVQGVLGAFDTLYHHEIKEKLAYRAGAERELAIHALRSVLYALIFGGLALFEWRGFFALVMGAIFAVEIALTLWDFVVEDRTRRLPASERVTHTILAINGGVFLALLVPELIAAAAMPSALAPVDHGWRAALLIVFAIGLVMSGLRDLHASRLLSRTVRGVADADFGSDRLHVLVTGATGFIGQRLVWTLLEGRHDVTVYARKPAAAWMLFAGRVRAIGDLRELTPDDAFDAIVNLAGEPVVGLPWTAARKRRLFASRIATTHALVRYMRFARQRPGVLISASAVGYYGNHGDEALSEHDAPQDIFVSRLCREWEREAHSAENLGVRLCIVRLGIVLGWGGAFPLLVAPHLLALGARIGSGRQWVSWVHVDDVIRACAFLVRRDDALGAFNLTAPEPLPQSRFAEAIGRTLGRPVWLAVPAAPLRVLVGEMAEIFTHGQRVLPQRLTALGFRFSVPAVADALLRLRGRRA